MSESNREEDLLERIARVAADLGPALEPPGYQALLESITDAVRSMLDAAACSIAVFDEENERLQFIAASGAGADQIVGTSLPAAQGIAGWVMASGQSITVTDVAKDPRFAAEVAESTGYIPTSVFAVPLPGDRYNLGVLEVLDPTVDTADQDLARSVAVLIEHATLAVRTSRIFEDLARTLTAALADAAASQDRDVAAAFERVSARAKGPAKGMADLAALFYELSRVGEDERAAATQMLLTFVRYVLSREDA